MAPALALALGLGLAAAAVGLLARLLAHRPGLLPLLVLAALPFRVPVAVGGQSASLLVPLYLVLAAGAVAFLASSGRRRRLLRPPGPLAPVLAGAIVLYGLQAAYSTDPVQALKNLAFFYGPFLLLFALLAAAPWSSRGLRAALGVLVALALVFVAIGFWEYATRRLLLNPKVIESNQFESFFRVNSLFFDPNIYGRFLAMAMLALATVLVWTRRARTLALAALALALLWAGLVLTFSQSSFTALLAGLAVVAALRWGGRPVAAGAALALLAALLAVLLAPSALGLGSPTERSLDRASSGRLDLMRGGLGMWLERPLWGFGAGSFSERFRERERVSSQRAASASHTIPITVAAEQGAIGLAAYGLVLWAALRAVFGGLGGLRRRGPPSEKALARAFVAAAFVALLVHTLLYAAFLEDPLTWALLGAAAGLRREGGEGAGSNRSGEPASASAEPARTGSSTPSGTGASHPR